MIEPLLNPCEEVPKNEHQKPAEQKPEDELPSQSRDKLSPGLGRECRMGDSREDTVPLEDAEDSVEYTNAD